MIHHNPPLLRFPDEAAIVGRMVVGFGELEVMTCRVASKANSHPDHVLKMLYGLRSTSARIKSATLLMEPHYAAVDLAEPQTMTWTRCWPASKSATSMLTATGPIQIQRPVCFLPICKSQQNAKTGSQAGSTSTFLCSPNRKLSSAMFAARCSFWKPTWSTSGTDGHATMGFQSRWCFQSRRCTIPQASTFHRG
jgi:hypothetical protein